jgi:hypothetical protein
VCLSSPSPLHFSDYNFLVHNPVNWDDRHLLGLWLISCMEVFSKRIFFYFVTDKILLLIRQKSTGNLITLLFSQASWQLKYLLGSSRLSCKAFFAEAGFLYTHMYICGDLQAALSRCNDPFSSLLQCA